jgi:hypothetical protein
METRKLCYGNATNCGSSFSRHFCHSQIMQMFTLFFNFFSLMHLKDFLE